MVFIYSVVRFWSNAPVPRQLHCKRLHCKTPCSTFDVKIVTSWRKSSVESYRFVTRRINLEKIMGSKYERRNESAEINNFYLKKTKYRSRPGVFTTVMGYQTGDQAQNNFAALVKSHFGAPIRALETITEDFNRWNELPLSIKFYDDFILYIFEQKDPERSFQLLKIKSTFTI